MGICNIVSLVYMMLFIFFLIEVDNFKSLELNDLVRSFQASDLVDTLRRLKKMKQNHRKYETYDFD